MATNIQPLADRVVVQIEEDQEQTESGILLPGTMSKDKPMLGKVISVGPKVAKDLKAGATVIFGKYSPTEVKIKGEEYLILKEEDVLAVLS